MKRLIALAFIFLCLYSCKHGGPRYLLRLEYNKGVQTDLEYHYYIVTNGNPDDPVQNEVVRMGFKVDSLMDDSLFNLSAKVDYIRMVDKNSFALAQFSFDTEEPPTGNNREAQRYNLLIKPMVDSALRLTVSNKGTIVHPFTFSRGRRLPGPDPLDYQLCQPNFPADSVAIGEKWTHERTIDLTNEKWTAHYYIESIRDSVININLYGTLTQGDRKSKLTGQYAIEQKTGALISGKVEVKGEVMLQGSGKLVIDITSRDWGFQ